MNQSVGVRELRQQASAVLKRVAAGEVIEVTDHGRPVARIVPLRHGAFEQMVLEGRATEATEDLLELMNDMALPLPVDPGTISPSEALAELRADER